MLIALGVFAVVMLIILGAYFLLVVRDEQKLLERLAPQGATGGGRLKGGIIKAGAKLINAVSNSTVPSITLMIGASYGAGNYAMNGRAYNPRFVFTWPNHRIAVMGPEQLAGVLDLVKRQAAAQKGEAVNEQELATMKQMLVGKVDYESTAWAATGRLFDDGVIDPRDTRAVLAELFAVCRSSARRTPRAMQFSVARP